MKIGMKVLKSLGAKLSITPIYKKDGSIDEVFAKGLAEIIERESGVREMVEALKAVRENSMQGCFGDQTISLKIIDDILQKYGAE